MQKKVWSYLTAIFGGIILGIIGMFYMSKNEYGDEYEIKRPKVKGENNILEVIQTNKSDKQKRKKRFKLRKNKKQ